MASLAAFPATTSHLGDVQPGIANNWGAVLETENGAEVHLVGTAHGNPFRL